MQPRTKIFSYLGSTLLVAAFVTILSAFFNPIASQVVKDIFRNTLSTSLSEPVRLPVELDKAIACIDDISRIARRLENDTDKLFPLRDESIFVNITGKTLTQCNNIFLHRPDDGYLVQRLTISNETDVSARNITLFSSDADYLIQIRSGDSVEITSKQQLKKGFNFGDLPPNTTIHILIAGHIFSDVFIESSFGQKIIQIRSFIYRWGILIAGFSFVILVMIILILLTFIVPVIEKNPKGSGKANNGPEE